MEKHSNITADDEFLSVLFLRTYKTWKKLNQDKFPELFLQASMYSFEDFYENKKSGFKSIIKIHKQIGFYENEIIMSAFYWKDFVITNKRLFLISKNKKVKIYVFCKIEDIKDISSKSGFWSAPCNIELKNGKIIESKIASYHPNLSRIKRIIELDKSNFENITTEIEEKIHNNVNITKVTRVIYNSIFDIKNDIFKEDSISKLKKTLLKNNSKEIFESIIMEYKTSFDKNLIEEITSIDIDQDEKKVLLNVFNVSGAIKNEEIRNHIETLNKSNNTSKKNTGIPWIVIAIIAGFIFAFSKRDMLGEKGGFIIIIGAIVLGVISANRLRGK